MTVTYREPGSPDTPLYLPSNMATMLNELKPENQSFNDYGIELLMFAVETVTKANEISSRQETMRSMLDKITEKFYDIIADIGSEIGNKFTDEQGDLLSPIIATIEQSANTLEGFEARIGQLEELADLSAKTKGFGKVVHDLELALDPNRNDSVTGLVSTKINHMFSDGTSEREFLLSLIQPLEQSIQQLTIQLSNADSADKATANTTIAGNQFEEQVGIGLMQYFGDRSDVNLIAKGSKADGAVRHSKKGDFVIEALGKHRSEGRKIVVEAKKDKSFDNIQKCVTELKAAMDNRGADVGIFILSSDVAPRTIPAFWSYENTIIITWDCKSNSPELKAAAILAEALLPSDSFDPEIMDKVRTHIGVLEKELNRNNQMHTTISSMEGNLEKMNTHVRVQRKNLNLMVDQIRSLLDNISKGGIIDG
tara:strand:- start:40 stop:1311 length:1272 start_codon:yes stop_codon:yes gene_type:complete